MQEQENVRMHVVVVTGMSGSGKSVVMDVLEDIGYYCIDNLPPQLIGKFVEICRESENHLQKLAIAADLRSGDMFTDAYRTLLEMKQQAGLMRSYYGKKICPFRNMQHLPNSVWRFVRHIIRRCG